MKSSWYISRRMSLGGKNRVASVLAVAGVGCATLVMVLTLAVSLGFKHEIRSRLSGFNADISVKAPFDYTTGMQQQHLEVTPQLRATVLDVTGAPKATLAFRQPGLIKTDDNYAALMFTAYDSTYTAYRKYLNMVDGAFPDFSSDEGRNAMVVSRHTASRLALKTGDRLTVCFFDGENVKARKLTLAGIYDSGFGDYDKTVCYASLRLMQSVCGLGRDWGTSLEVHHITPADSIAAIAARLQDVLINQSQDLQLATVPVVDNITNSGAVYLNWLDLLDTNVIVIFIIMCCVAAFTLVSSLFIVILNGVRTIGILRALGMTKRRISTIYVLVTLRLVGLGIIIGDVLAVALIVAQQHTHFMPLDPQMYYLSSVPAMLWWPGVAMVSAGVLLMGVLVLILPARLAATFAPSSTMRYD